MSAFEWQKMGVVFNPQNHETPSWMEEFAQAPCVVEFSNYLRIYFSSRPKPDQNKNYVSYSGFIDVAKDNFFQILNISQKPILELGDLGCFDEFGTYPVSVIKNQNDFYAYYAGWTRCHSVPFNVGIGIAKSKDNGVTFQKLGKGPILPYTPDEPFILSGPKIRYYNNRYYLFYIAGIKWVLDKNKPEPVYQIRLAISDDGLNWSKMNKSIIPPNFENEAQASPDVFYLNGKYHMFFSYRKPLDYRNKKNGYRIGYAWSLDLINWTRENYSGIDVSDSGWDSEMVCYSNVYIQDSNVYMFYLGNGVGKTGFGLAQLKGEL